MGYGFDPEWILVDWILASGSTTPTFTSGGNGVLNYPVNGNIDQGYRIRWDLTGNASGAVAQIELQAGTTNQTALQYLSDGAVSTGTNLAHAGLVCNQTSASSKHQGFWVMPNSVTGGNGRCAYMMGGSVGAANKRQWYTGSRYNDTATNITSIRFNATTGNLTGTIWLEVLNPQRGV